MEQNDIKYTQMTQNCTSEQYLHKKQNHFSLYNVHSVCTIIKFNNILLQRLIKHWFTKINMIQSTLFYLQPQMQFWTF